MSQARRIAFVLLLAAGAAAAFQQAPAATEAPRVKLASFGVVEGWCGDICDSTCASEGGCADSRAVGCTCYWVCEDEGEGSSYCTGAIGVKVCS